MMQPELLHLSWPFFNNIDSSFDEVDGMEMNVHMGHFELSPPFTTDNSPDFSLVSYFPTVSDEFVNFPFHVDEMQVVNLEELDPILSGEIVDMSGLLEASEGSFPSHHQLSSIEGEDEEWSRSPSLKSSDTSMDVTLIQPPLILPNEAMEIDNQLSLSHLAKAYGEAMENEQTELAEGIMRRISEKVSPVGEIVERLLYHTFQPLDKQEDYLKQESSKNFDAAFKAFYRIFPYGMIAHLTANSAILEAMPHDAKTVHIIDFDMGEGVQWASMIEALGQQQNMLQQQMTLKLTSIKWREEDRGNCVPSQWSFDGTKRRLYDHARSFGLKLKVEELELQDLVSEIKKIKKRGGRREWLTFNCMVGLPHMGRARSRSQIMEFLSVAREFLSYTANYNTSDDHRGIITFGDGDAWAKLKNGSGFGSFFDSYMEHYQALLESMEWGFPIHLAEARIAMECLFVAPHVSSLAWMQKWEEMKESPDFQSGFGLEGLRMSNESIMEAKEMAKESESLYSVRIEGESENEMALEWRGTPLMKISAWR